jgi:hypothetical protein
MNNYTKCGGTKLWGPELEPETVTWTVTEGASGRYCTRSLGFLQYISTFFDLKDSIISEHRFFRHKPLSFFENLNRDSEALTSKDGNGWCKVLPDFDSICSSPTV